MNENRSLSLRDNNDFASMDQRDRITPRLKLMQFTSNEVKSKLFDVGALVDVTGKRLICAPEANVGVIHLMFWKEWIEFNPKQGAPKNEIILNRSTDPNSPIAKLAGNFMANKIMTARGERQKVTEIYNFILLAPEATESWEEMFIFSYMKTGHKVGKQLLNRMQVLKQTDPVSGETGKARIWAYQWEMRAEKTSNNSGEEYFVPRLGNCTLTPQDAWQHLGDLSSELQGRRAQLSEQVADGLAGDAAGDSQLKDVSASEV